MMPDVDECFALMLGVWMKPFACFATIVVVSCRGLIFSLV